ncbi:MAG: CoA pyrophosphatase [Deltaproteobacteria bacterium]|nr:CoA pyrophosphatase [Deltaproteobacteria bacterium]MBW2446293.1 CoA pyrophosphatase [Deltaproteobacteria bacterium]
MPSISEIREALARRAPTLEPDRADDGSAKKRAAVAMILRPSEVGQGAEVLFIERAQFAGDPWSGHMAFPGGRVEASDDDPRSTAERETLEEVGVTLAGAECLGQLDDLRGRHAGREIPMVISAYVYVDEDPAPLEPNHEVAEAFWFPLSELLDPGRRDFYEIRSMRFPGVLVGKPQRHVVWGLTYRFLEIFFERLGRPLPDRWEELSRYRDGDGSDEDLEKIERRLLDD